MTSWSIKILQIYQIFMQPIMILKYEKVPWKFVLLVSKIQENLVLVSHA